MFNEEISIIIPVAGCGKRTKSRGPKCLMEIEKGVPILRRQLDLVRATFPKSQIVIVAGFKYNRVLSEIKRYNLQHSTNIVVVINNHYEQTNVARSISIGLSSSKIRESLIIYGDLVFSDKFLKNFSFENSNMIVDNNNFIDRREVGAVCSNGFVTNMSYGISTKWSQVVYLKERDAKLFRKFEQQMPQTVFGFEVLNKLIESGVSINYTFNSNWIVEVDNLKDLEKAKESLRKYEDANI